MPFDATAPRPLGSSGLSVSTLGFGSGPLGGLMRAVPDAEARATLDAAWAAGLRHFDTAPQYGHGLAEHRVGSGLRERPRDGFVLSTKVGKMLVPWTEGPDPRDMFVGALPFRITYDYSEAAVRRSLEDSLQRLGMNRIDVVFIHDVNRHYHGDQVEARFAEAMAGAVPALVELRRRGVIGAFGIGIQDVDICRRFVEAAPLDCVMLPKRYTLLDHEALDGLLPLCRQRGVGVLLAAPFYSGILATGAVADATFNYQPAPPEMLARTRAIEAICRRHGVPLAAAALQFPLGHPALTSVVAGMRAPDEVATDIALLAHPIPGDLWRDLKQAGLIPDQAPVPAA